MSMMLRSASKGTPCLLQAPSFTTLSSVLRRYIYSSLPSSNSALEEIKSKGSSIQPEPRRAKMKMEPYVKNLFHGIIDPNVFFYGQLDMGSLKVLENMKEEIEKFMNAEESAVIDREKKISSETIAKLKDLGIFKLNIPNQYGGMELTCAEMISLCEVFSKNPSLFQTINVHLQFISNLFCNFASDEQKQMYLPGLASGDLQIGFAAWEKTAGLDLSNIKCSAQFHGDKYTLSGSKRWVCNGGIADKYVVFALDDKDEALYRSVSCFLVDKNAEGISAKSMDTIGMHGYNAWEIEFDKTPVPVENVIGEHGQGLSILTSLLNGKTTLAGAYVGLLRDLLTTTVQHAIQHETFGKPLIEHDIVKSHLAEAACRLYALESIAYMTADFYDNIEDPDTEVEAAIVKLYSCETLTWMVQKCLSILGSDSYLKGKHFERILQDSLFCPLVETSPDSLRVTIALLGLEHVGKTYQDTVLKRRNPVFYPTEAISGWWRKTLKIEEEVKGFKKIIFEHLHPTLEYSAEHLENSILKLGLVVEETLVRWGSDINHNQVNLARLADIAIDLYVCTAVLARTSRALSIGLRNCDNDVNVANSIVYEAYRRMRSNVQLLDDSPYANSDANRIALLKAMVHEKRYHAAHPLQRTV